MARPSARRRGDPDARWSRFIAAVGDLPWAQQPAIEAYSRLPGSQIERRYRPQALERGWIERGDVPAARGRSSSRLGLTPKGAQVTGRSWHAAHIRSALLQAVNLDVARRLVTEWADRIVWVLSPFTLPVEAIRAPSVQRDKEPIRIDPERRHQNVQFAALATIKSSQGRGGYTSIAIMLDPGDIRLTWFGRQFRSLYAWSARPEFRGSRSQFPLVTLVAANESRRTQLIRLWRASAPHFGHVLRLRITTFTEMTSGAADRDWLDEHGRRVSRWSGLRDAKEPGVRPFDHLAGWWGDKTLPLAELRRRWAGQRHSRRRPDQPLLASAQAVAKKRRSSLNAKLVLWQLNLSAQCRWTLRYVGNYPLLNVTDLALVMGIGKALASHALTALREAGLVEQPRDHTGNALTWAGVALLAAQDGFPPERYARLHRWPVAYDARGRPRYSLEAWLAQPRHTGMVLGFLVGLRRFGPAQRVSLLVWDHIQCLESLPASEGPWNTRRVVPDAMGRVRLAAGAELDFWLEVDRGTLRGQALTHKLMLYYIVGGPQGGVRGWGVRVLVVVSSGDEPRLRKLQRCFRGLDRRYQAQLDVRFTRADLLDAGHGRLDPTRPVWRTPYSTDFASAFGPVSTLAPSHDGAHS